MTLRRRIVLTAVWTVVMLAIGIGGLWYIFEHPVRGATREARAARLGFGLGVFTAIGYAGLWLPWAYQIGRQRRAARDALARKKRRRQSRTPPRRST